MFCVVITYISPGLSERTHVYLVHIRMFFADIVRKESVSLDWFASFILTWLRTASYKDSGSA